MSYAGGICIAWLCALKGEWLVQRSDSVTLPVTSAELVYMPSMRTIFFFLTDHHLCRTIQDQDFPSLSPTFPSFLRGFPVSFPGFTTLSCFSPHSPFFPLFIGIFLYFWVTFLRPVAVPFRSRPSWLILSSRMVFVGFAYVYRLSLPRTYVYRRFR